MLYKYIETTDGLTVVIEGKPYNVSSRRDNYFDIFGAMQLGQEPAELLALIEAKGRAVRALVEKQLTKNLTYNDGCVLYKGQVLHNRAVSRMSEMIKQGLDIAPLAAFVEKLMTNPRQGVIGDLYEFLEFGKIPITVDGDFLVYKAVRPDYLDIHSGTFLNKVGSAPEVSMDAVDPDRDRTCSRGLHVCSYAYLPSFASVQGHVMMCKVNPADVGAIPSDYNNTKMRVRKYTVVEEVTGYYQRGEDVLGTGALVKDLRYEVRDEDGDLYDEFYTLDEAKIQVDALPNGGYVYDREEDKEVYEA